MYIYTIMLFELMWRKHVRSIREIDAHTVILESLVLKRRDDEGTENHCTLCNNLLIFAKFLLVVLALSYSSARISIAKLTYRV
jgi:hypothetical protein